ncbi:hypothetical protein PHMEG_00033365 [Phytophthora megakarya]|uniref:Uncharacterized protein n=1 Tax=Phytophthora megakarya TaxID=4795 RepID=A0A225UUA6_9STRA|nr:hypothetical protein PHMEG_00033365 [Phytophthora megakarya]
MLTLRIFSNSLDDFDEKQSLTARRRWWEKFLNMTIRADSEKYYRMIHYKDETALAFLSRLNLAPERADVKFRKSERRREQHIKGFIKNLTDMSLRSTLQSQRFYKVSDLEAANVARGGVRQRDSNRVYVAQDDEGVDVEQSAQDEQDVDAQILNNPNGTFLNREELIHEVYRIMNNVGWKPQTAFQGYQPYNNPDRLEFCEKCKKCGHRPEKCWTDMNITMDIAKSGKLSKRSRNPFFKEA